MNPPDLLSLVLTLRPLGAAHGLPDSLARASHAVLLNAVGGADPALAGSLHEGSGPRPFTASDLIGLKQREGLRPERTYALRFTALTAGTASALLAASAGGPLALGAEVVLGESGFRVEAVEGGEETPDSKTQTPKTSHPWAGAATYKSLSAPWLLARERPAARLALDFVSPTTFKSGGKHVPLPLPELVFGSLLEKWNAFAPVALPPETRRFAAECLALSRYRLSSRVSPMKEGGLRTGMVGMAVFTALNHDRYWLTLLNLLADFALYAGVGAGTTMGLGQCRKEEGRRK